MIELIDGMYLYHGSYTAVEYIDLPKCERLDFGKGFYLTSSYEQQMCLPIVLMVQMPSGSILLQVTERVDCLINSSKSLNRQILSVGTLRRYTAGDFGQPGTLEADIETVKRLLPNRLEDQFF